MLKTTLPVLIFLSAALGGTLSNASTVREGATDATIDAATDAAINASTDPAADSFTDPQAAVRLRKAGIDDLLWEVHSRTGETYEVQGEAVGPINLTTPSGPTVEEIQTVTDAILAREGYDPQPTPDRLVLKPNSGAAEAGEVSGFIARLRMTTASDAANALKPYLQPGDRVVPIGQSNSLAVVSGASETSKLKFVLSLVDPLAID